MIKNLFIQKLSITFTTSEANTEPQPTKGRYKMKTIIEKTSLGDKATINNKVYFFGNTKNVCECCGVYQERAFYKNAKIALVKKGKKIYIKYM